MSPGFLLLALSCAASNHYARIEIPGAYTDTSALELAADEMAWADAADVEVWIGDAPEGLQIYDGGLMVDDPDRYEVVAALSTNPKSHTAAFLGVWWYDYPEDQANKRKWCAWQVPLNWITLTTWSWYTPFYWPCRVAENNDPENLAARKARLVATMQTGARAVGANLVVIDRMGSLITVDAASGAALSTLDLYQASGYAVRDKSRE